jgi:hypothetical protein
MTLALTNEAVRRDNQAEKKLCLGKKINRHDREVMEDVRTVLPSNTRKVLQEWEIKFYLFHDYFAYFIECYL